MIIILVHRGTFAFSLDRLVFSIFIVDSLGAQVKAKKDRSSILIIVQLALFPFYAHFPFVSSIMK